MIPLEELPQVDPEPFPPIHILNPEIVVDVRPWPFPATVQQIGSRVVVFVDSRGLGRNAVRRKRATRRVKRG